MTPSHCPSMSKPTPKSFSQHLLCSSTVRLLHWQSLQAPAASGQAEHPNDSTGHSYMKQNLVKYFPYQSFLHFNLLTVNF